ncbi:hypothetical protein RI129_012000 [Pyrocoelia pectoralis]|uniref:SCA7 domain-containing protein n=1 Tax=Pyrocoelia pectoralis TaxID=417401 RepID=A0AAN7V2Z7_9COLE
MLENQLMLHNYNGQMWKNSPAQKLLENLPMTSSDVNSVMDTRYLLPREYIFTFGFENGITNPVIYFSCKLCQLLIKIHELKSHMLSKHPNLETSLTNLIPITSPPQSTTSKSKKNSHKSKKKVVPPPNVPPPPLFSNIEASNPVNTVPAIENLLPPVLQPVEIVKENSTFAIEVDDVPNDISPPILPTQTTEETSTLPTQTTEKIATLSAQITEKTLTPSATPTVSRVPAVSILKPKKDRLEMHKHKKYKKKKNDYDPDKHCGVIDHTNQPCMRSITCANHTIVERRAVRGRSTSIDSLISLYKTNKLKSKHRSVPTVPLNIAPKQEVKSGIKFIEVIYDKNCNPTNKISDNPPSLSIHENISSATHIASNEHNRENNVLKSIKIINSPNSGNLPPMIFLTSEKSGKPMVSAKLKTTNGKLIKLRLVQSNTTLPLPKLSDSSSPLTPTIYSLHPKPMTMLTGSLRRVGSSIVLQNSTRLDRQRMDLQAVINQHKQLKISVSNKAVLQLNSNHSKQSILKNNLKSSAFKRTSVDKSNDLKHMICACSYIKQLL